MFSVSEILLSLLEAFIIICISGRKFSLTIKTNILIALVRYLLTSHIQLVQNISLFTNAFLGNKRSPLTHFAFISWHTEKIQMESMFICVCEREREVLFYIKSILCGMALLFYNSEYY